VNISSAAVPEIEILKPFDEIASERIE